MARRVKIGSGAVDSGRLLFTGMTPDDWGTAFSADLDELRRLAFGILGATA